MLPTNDHVDRVPEDSRPTNISMLPDIKIGVCVLVHITKKKFRIVRQHTYDVCVNEYYFFMELESVRTNIGEIAKCRWCDKNIGLAYHVKTRVCMKCFRRLRSANIPDDEIFGREEIEPTRSTTA